MRIGIEYFSIDFFRKLLNKGYFHQIVRKFRSGYVIIVEGSLSPLEKSNILKEIMKVIDTEFYGIEFFEVTAPGRIRRKKMVTIITPKLRMMNFEVTRHLGDYEILFHLRS
ncbi:MAG: OapB/ArvB family protein [Candidatus Njordarchaeales archaeon]